MPKRKKLRILMPDGWPGSLSFFFARAFLRLEHEVYQFSPDGLLVPQSKDKLASHSFTLAHDAISLHGHKNFLATLLRKLNNYVGNLIMQYRLPRLVRNVRPDILFLVKNLNLTKTTLDQIREAWECLIFFFHPEDFLYPSENSTPAFLQCIPLYDCIFTPTKVNVQEYLLRGAQRAEYLPYGYDPEWHFPVNIPPSECLTYCTDIAFVGKWTPQRADFLEALAGHYKLGIWGNMWEHVDKKSPIRPFLKFRYAVGDEMRKVYSGARIALTFVMRPPQRQMHVMRTFEIPACGALQLSERTDEQTAFFEEGKEIVCYGSKEEFLEKVKYLVKNHQARNQIACAGSKRLVESRYTYEARMQKVISVYEDLKGCR
ncbi:MAG: glycosyltransferase [Candidatus Methanomethyliaceae archaeon]